MEKKYICNLAQRLPKGALMIDHCTFYCQKVWRARAHTSYPSSWSVVSVGGSSTSLQMLNSTRPMPVPTAPAPAESPSDSTMVRIHVVMELAKNEVNNSGNKFTQKPTFTPIIVYLKFSSEVRDSFHILTYQYLSFSCVTNGAPMSSESQVWSISSGYLTVQNWSL